MKKYLSAYIVLSVLFSLCSLSLSAGVFSGIQLVKPRAVDLSGNKFELFSLWDKGFDGVKVRRVFVPDPKKPYLGLDVGGLTFAIVFTSVEERKTFAELLNSRNSFDVELNIHSFDQFRKWRILGRGITGPGSSDNLIHVESTEVKLVPSSRLSLCSRLFKFKRQVFGF